ncbi:MAG: cytochrome ubiquinol oxidase subunit I [Pseudomonadota bacterium]
MQTIQFPLIGNTNIMAIIILVHVFFAFVAVGALCLAFYWEMLAVKKQKPNYDKLAYKIVKAISDMMKLNGVLGVGILILLISLFPIFTSKLYRIFFWGLILELIAFFFLMLSSIFYLNTFKKKSNLHNFWGLMACTMAIFAALIINAVHSFMLTPGNYFSNLSLIDAIFNPSMIPSAFHLIIPCIINAAMIIFLFYSYRTFKNINEYNAFSRDEARKVINLLIFLQPIAGISYLLTIYNFNKEAYKSLISGLASYPFWIMIILASMILILNITSFFIKDKLKNIIIILMCLLAFTTFVFGGYARERARKPYLIYGHMYSNQLLNEKNDVAAESKYNKKTINAVNIMQKNACTNCHKINGSGGGSGGELVSLYDYFDKETLKELLTNPPEGMTPFVGSEDEMDVLIKFLMNL